MLNEQLRRMQVLAGISYLNENKEVEGFETKNNTVGFYYDVDTEPTSEQIQQIKDGFVDEIGKEIKLQVKDNRFFFGGDSDLVEHLHLDVAESLVKNIVGKNPNNLKSELVVISDEGYTVQPYFVLTKVFDDNVIKEIDRLYKFVTGIDGIGYFSENRYYIDTQQERMQHGELDVAELLVRRNIESIDIKVNKVHGFKALPPQK